MSARRTETVALLGLVALAAACGYQDHELAPCWPSCDGGTVGTPGADAGEALALTVAWTTPHSVALSWPSGVPADVTGYSLTVGDVTWDARHDPRLGARGTTQAVVLGLTPGTTSAATLTGLTAGGDRVVARGVVVTPAEATATLTIYAEGDAPPRTVLMQGGAPDTHAGTSALWFAAASVGAGDGPALSGLTLGGAALEAAVDRAYLELWLRVWPSGGAIVPLTTQLYVDGVAFRTSALLVPAQGGWHRLQVPLVEHRREGGVALTLPRGALVTGLALEAAWLAGTTVVVDDLALRY